ncbi:type II toxin-antitoxin system RelE/ParE family toxin [Rosenbergiella collisarenosi]|uniref:type II toxin-antitoxin system RelE/ParE family toxin n=1 Tax=Rosenbergiella collisarenosi TaxID=1544695 RepID=UPI001F4D9F6E|nr:type II toxin-antitoxin system RelE/ParE family toxin [Rosenbergiella collisarenosi]
MACYLDSEFEEERLRLGITDSAICQAAKRLDADSHDGQLSAFIYKMRLPAQGRGKRGGARSVVCYKKNHHQFFIFLYAKAELSKKKGKEIEDEDIEAFALIGKDLCNLPDENLKSLVLSGVLKEVECV